MVQHLLEELEPSKDEIGRLDEEKVLGMFRGVDIRAARPYNYRKPASYRLREVVLYD